jgi:hypothetical protein
VTLDSIFLNRSVSFAMLNTELTTCADERVMQKADERN